MVSLRLTFYVTGIAALLTSTASAQLNGVAGAAAAARTNAQVQQQVQSRVQQQVQAQAQAQVQARAQAQVQSRLQAEAVRAASIAQRATVTAQSQMAAAVKSQSAAARQRASSGLNLRLATNTRVATNAGVGNTGARMDASTAARLGLDTRLSLPADLTLADVQVYDKIFGQFNPLREGRSGSKTQVGSRPKSGADSSPPSETSDGSTSPRNRRSGLLASLESDVSLNSRINVAARQRRAQISEVRDRALASSDTQLMLKAQKMEDALNAFASAQTQLKTTATTRAQQASQTKTARPNSQPVGRGNFSANGSSTSSGSANVGRSPSPTQPGSSGSPSDPAPAGSIRK